jgi:hypothetical protein
MALENYPKNRDIILSSVKENTKHRKEHAKTAQKKRDEFASYETETSPDQFNKKKKSKKR